MATPPDALAEQWEDQEGDIVVMEVIDGLVASAVLQAEVHELKAKAVPYTVQCVTASMKAVVSMYFLDHDVGEPDLSASASWAIPAEPIPAPIDSWSRGAVPVKAREEPAPAASEGQPPLSARSIGSASGLPPRSPRVRTPSIRPTSTGGVGGRADAPPADASLQPVFVAKASAGAVVEKGKGKKETAVVTAAERRAKRLALEAREEAERLERLRTELKGREYTYDTHGNVIVFEPVHHDRLPAIRQQPRLGESASDVGPAGTAKRLQPKAPRGGPKEGRPARHQPGGRPKLEFGSGAAFRQLESLQPPILDSTMLKEGVRLTQGEATKAGEPRRADPCRMTRAQFEEMASASGALSSRCPVTGGGEGEGGGLADAAAELLLDRSAPSEGGARPPPVTGGHDASGGGQPPALRPTHKLSPDSPPGRNAAMRERGGVPVKSRLPPPQLGETTGHGLSMPYRGGAPASPLVG